MLQGLGEFIRRVKAGVIEMPRDHTVKLYKDQKYTVEDAKKFFAENGFVITEEHSNDVQHNEFNLYFQRI